MKSMTGYGKGVAEKQNVKLSVEIKAVNHRFLDISVKMPKNLFFVENDIRKELKNRLSRGHLDVFINLEDRREEKTKLKLDEDLLKNYLNIASILNAKFALENNFKVSEIMKLDNILVAEENDIDNNILNELVLIALNIAVDNLTIMRENEGEMIKKDILDKICLIESYVVKVSELSPLKVIEYKNKLTERVTELLGEVVIDEAKLINEVAFYSDKVSVDEETIRLKVHLANMIGYLEETESVGRKLDFIVQELNREANTIGSKCSDVEISGTVLNLKNEIEKIREQVQNIE